MRHFIVPSPISSGPDRMSQASTAAALITSPRLAHTLAAGSTGAVLAAVALSPVAAAADRYLRTAAAAQKEAAREHPRRSFRSAAGGSGKRSTECADNAIVQVAHRQWSVTPSPDLPVEIGVTPDCFCGADYPQIYHKAGAGGVRRKPPQGDQRRAPRLSPSQPHMISTAPQRRPPATALVEERAGGRLCSFQRFSSCRRLLAVFDHRRQASYH